MLFTRALLALPLLGAVFAVPTALVKRDSIVDVVNDFSSSVSPTIAALASAASAGTLDATIAESYLSSIIADIQSASAAVGGSSARRALVPRGDAGKHDAHTKRDDLSEVGAALAEVIKDLVEAVEQIAVDLEAVPLVGTLIDDIDLGLDTLLLGVEVVLEVVQGLLTGVSDLLAGLGSGLLAALLGF